MWEKAASFRRNNLRDNNRFARDPNARQFEDRAVRAMYSDWWMQWPWPLSDHENPVPIEVEDERAWCKKRAKMQDARRREIRT